MELKLPYGLRDNELITIDNVESGLKCNCVCPYCKQRLIARKGEIKEHHFAHYKVSDCGKAVETVTHRLSKDFIKGAKFFTTPPIYFPGTKVPIIEESQVPIDDVKLESRLGFIVPDIIIDSGTKSLIVEIRVTHGVDDEKASKIRRLNLPAGAPDFVDNNNNWTAAEFNNANMDNAALDAHWATEMVYGYFNSVHSRNSWNGSGGPLLNYVHTDLTAFAG